LPTYEYNCECGESFEKFLSITASSETECPKCGEKVIRDVSGGTGIIFKGSGFYVTDNRKAEKK